MSGRPDAALTAAIIALARGADRIGDRLRPDLPGYDFPSWMEGEEIDRLWAFERMLVESARELRRELLDAGFGVELPVDVAESLHVPTDPAERCGMWCEGRPIGVYGSPSGGGAKASCPECKTLTRFLSHEVLPSIRRHGYWSPETASVDEEFVAMLDQQGFREGMRVALDGLFGDGFSDAIRPE